MRLGLPRCAYTIAAMIHSGLVSVTFRKIAPAEIVSLVRQLDARADMQPYDWEGDATVYRCVFAPPHSPHPEVFAAPVLWICGMAVGGAARELARSWGSRFVLLFWRMFALLGGSRPFLSELALTRACLCL